MLVSSLINEDFVNYKKPAMFIGAKSCTFKCGPENCQNYGLIHENLKYISNLELTTQYLNTPYTHAIVCGGLEPFDDWDDLISFIDFFREHSNDDIVIYTGYEENEIEDKIKILKQYSNIIIKFGRYIANDEPHYDDVLGITLVSSNQYGKKIS